MENQVEYANRRIGRISAHLNPLTNRSENYNAKLSDFGFARDGPTGDKSHVSTRVMGTYGYAAPEYLSTDREE